MTRVDYSYNPWPLGRLPIEFQRPELQQIRDLGYEWSDPREIVDLFEIEIAKYSGSRFAVVVDCCSHAIFLCLKYLNYRGIVIIPERTYVSVPMQIIHAGATPTFSDYEWTGTYELKNTNIIDGAGRFTQGMYEDRNSLHVLSFQIKKRLPIGRGGAILTDDLEARNWLRLARYDGRHLDTPYDVNAHVQSLGWHYYMTPEDAARGLLLLSKTPLVNDDVMGSCNYPALSTFELFSKQHSDGNI